jgi:hypothetical protein
MAGPTKASDGLGALAGAWTTEASHPLLPGTEVRGTAVFEWLEGGKFLILRSTTDHRDFPDAISIIGDTARDRVDAPAPAKAAGLRMHYFDERGVHRVYEARIGADAWELARDAPGFSQRFTGRFTDGGNAIAGLWTLSQDGKRWADDLRITYRRRQS